MRALLPHPAQDVDLHAVYAADWLEPGGLRVNFVSAADGAAQADGTSEGLQTPGDNRVFAVLRDLADVVLAGAGTAVAEGYRPVVLSERRRSVRRDLGLREALPTAVISRTLRLDPDHDLFSGAKRESRTIVLTCETAPADQRKALEQVADVAICGGEDVEPAQIRAALEHRGLTRILSEGGPTSFAQLAAEPGVVDELCLSLSPLLAGPGPGRITAGPPWPHSCGLELTGLLEEDGALFLRYRLHRRQPETMSP